MRAWKQQERIRLTSKGFSLCRNAQALAAEPSGKPARSSGSVSTCCRTLRCVSWQRYRHARWHARDDHVPGAHGGQLSRVARLRGAWQPRCDDGLRGYGAPLRACAALLLLWTCCNSLLIEARIPPLRQATLSGQVSAVITITQRAAFKENWQFIRSVNPLVTAPPRLAVFRLS
jgi:hypothetical protein